MVDLLMNVMVSLPSLTAALGGGFQIILGPKSDHRETLGRFRQSYEVYPGDPRGRLTETDHDIIEAIRAGAVRRFAELVDRHKEKALTLALRLVGNRQEAEELVQDAFVRAYRGLDTFRGDAKFSTWFYRILYNVCMTKALRRPLQETMSDRRDESEGDSLAATDPDPSVLDRMEERETIDMIQEELARLPEHYRAVLTLFYVQEMSHEEMAGVLQMPVGTIKTHLFRGRTALRDRIVRRWKREEVLR